MAAGTRIRALAAAALGAAALGAAPWAWSAEQTGAFASADANGDGRVSMQEAFDRNHDGIVSLGEVYAFRNGLRDWLAVKGRAGTGLDRAEFSAFRQRAEVPVVGRNR